MEKIYSFDIFDTLLLRPYADPQELWNVLEEIEQAPGFAKARKKADAKTFQEAIARGGETTIEEAYEFIPEYKHLMQKEMDLERRILRANPEMLKMWKDLGAQGKRRIIISDMYLPSDFIQNVLREKGYDGWEGFYLSRDYDCRKSSGKLFEVMLKKEGVMPGEVLHIGDNLVSDVKIPESLGIRAHHYTKVMEQFYKICPFARLIDGRLSGTLALGWHQFVYENPNASYWHRLGFIMGGLLGYIYVKWIVETARQLDKDRLMFVARDGYVWKAICNELFPEFKTEYFYAPRLTSIAVLGAIGSDPMAVKERQKYLEQHLKDVDCKAIKTGYQHYMEHFQIDEKTALVDGCSSAFSAQRLVEVVVGHSVFSFYLLAMAKRQNIAALYATELVYQKWQMLSEFLFGAPEKPIRGVSNDKPIYDNSVPVQEQFKIEVSQQIKEGAVACAKILHKENINISANEWLGYVDTFMSHLSEEDETNLLKAQNAVDVQQKNFRTILYKPSHPFIKIGRKYIMFETKQGKWMLYFNFRGLHYRNLSTLFYYISKA